MRIRIAKPKAPKAGDRTRTGDPLFTRQVLYQLSYSGSPGG